MTASRLESTQDVWGRGGPDEALAQVARLVQKTFGDLKLRMAPGSTGFRAVLEDRSPATDVESIHAALADDVIRLRVDLVKAAPAAGVDAQVLFRQLADLGPKRGLYADSHEGSAATLGAELQVRAEPMSVAREAELLESLSKLKALARTLRESLPRARSDAELEKLYKRVAEVLEPVAALSPEACAACPELRDWARETLEFLDAGASIALASGDVVSTRAALAAVATVARESGSSIGRLVKSGVSANALLELCRSAPGIVALPATALSVGVSMYEMGSSVQALLEALSNTGTGVAFYGTLPELQKVLHGGQGGANNPLAPVLRRVPGVPVSLLASYAVQEAARASGGLSPAREQVVTGQVMDAVAEALPADQRRLLPLVAQQSVHSQGRAGVASATSPTAFARTVAACTETLAGLSARPRTQRSAKVQEHLLKVLTDPGLVGHLKSHLLAQDRAIDELVTRLQTEVLTRAQHQPIRWCAQGTPGTGKTESAVLLAQRLDVPYVNVDAASLPSHYMAVSQLLGSARGVVGSYQSGRLEQAAKHHAGVVMELSDVDHASPDVRCFLADLFLQVLDAGEAQSATGSMFSCANVIFAFTMNLPGGQDEGVHRAVGFAGDPSHEDVQQKVTDAVKEMLSGAFLSRVGAPILFDPLTGEAMSQIVEAAVRDAVRSAAEQMGLPVQQVEVADGLGATLVSEMRANATSFGARALMERGRSLATRAVLDLLREASDGRDAQTLVVTAGPAGGLVVAPG